MTNRLAIILGAVVLFALALNFYFGWEHHIFLARKLMDLIEYLAFWR